MVFRVTVPRVPGVPSVNFSANVSLPLTFLTADVSFGFGLGSRRAPWGIYQGGSPVVLADNVVSFDYRQQWAISDFPVERGGFQSFNKVYIPYDARFRFTAGGSEANREALLSSIAAIAGLTTVYNIVTPEAIYPSATITHYDYTRTSNNGLGLMIVDVWTQEVRETAARGMSNVSNPVSSPQTNGGAVQAVPATTVQQSKLPPIREQGRTGPF